VDKTDTKSLRGKKELVRGLTLRDATALVVGTIIGTGVFLKTARMAQAAGSPELVLFAWIAAGLLSLAGALTYAELGAMLPKAGGEYVFLQTAYGDLPAFLFGWMRIVVGSSGSIASFGVAFALFLSAFIPLDAVWLRKSFEIFGIHIDWQFGIKQIVAVGIILFFSVLNCARVVFGGRVQSILTFGKVLGIAAIVIGVFFFAPNATWENFRAPAGSASWCGFSAFGAAMLAALWAFDGWNNMPMVSGEVRNPGRNIPLALVLGMGIVLLVYAAINLAYFYALPFSEVVTSSSSLYGNSPPVVSKTAATFLGSFGSKFVSVAVLLSVIGVLNGSILTSARIPFAMARDGLFFSKFAALGEKSAVPVAAILLQGTWASLLSLSATFDQLTDGVVFAGMIFYASCCFAVIVLRKKMPDAPRPYRTFGYPIVPLLFVVVAVWLLFNTLKTSPAESRIGLVLIALGLPLYFWQRRKRIPAPSKIEAENSVAE
jgi:APA family basic amino acid/polyamine antiporter